MHHWKIKISQKNTKTKTKKSQPLLKKKWPPLPEVFWCFKWVQKENNGMKLGNPKKYSLVFSSLKQNLVQTILFRSWSSICIELTYKGWYESISWKNEEARFLQEIPWLQFKLKLKLVNVWGWKLLKAVRPATLLKRVSNIAIFLWILWNF